MKTLLLTMSLFLGLMFGTTATAPQPFEYNVGLCSPDQFVALHVIMEPKFLTVEDVANGPDSVDKLAEPVSFKLDSTDKDGTLHFSGVKDISFSIKIDKDHKVSGFFEVSGQKQAILIGAPGEEKNLGSDGSAFFESCEAHRKGDSTDKATN